MLFFSAPFSLSLPLPPSSSSQLTIGAKDVVTVAPDYSELSLALDCSKLTTLATYDIVSMTFRLYFSRGSELLL